MVVFPNNFFIKKFLAFLKNFLLISIRLLPLLYLLTLALANIAAVITEVAFGIYAISFRPTITSLLMLVVLWILSLERIKIFNKYLWYGVSGESPSKVIYFWLSAIFGTFGFTTLVAAVVNIIYGPDATYGLFNLREDIFYFAMAALIISPIGITLHLSRKAIN